MALKAWNELPIKVRRSRRNLYNYIKGELEGNSSEEAGSHAAEPVVEQPTTRNISITVNDGTDAVEGASVAIGQITGTTGSAGGCTLQAVADGEQTVTVTAEGFENYSDTITVSGDSTSFTISLTAATQGDSQEVS